LKEAEENLKNTEPAKQALEAQIENLALQLKVKSDSEALLENQIKELNARITAVQTTPNTAVENDVCECLVVH
jgi:hypothetical protein